MRINSVDHLIKKQYISITHGQSVVQESMAVVTIACPAIPVAPHHLISLPGHRQVFAAILSWCISVTVRSHASHPATCHGDKAFREKQHRWLPIEVQWRIKRLVFHINQSSVFHVDEQAMNVRR